MVSLSSISPEYIKYDKIWKTKDKFLFTVNKKEGHHWKLKKFLILLENFIIIQQSSDKALKKTIEQLKKFIDSIDDVNEKKTAEKYFFTTCCNTDFRDLKKVINLKKFDDKDGKRFDALRHYICYLGNFGYQGGIKKEIGDQWCKKNPTMKKFFKYVDKRKKEEQRKRNSAPWVQKQKVDGIISDAHAEIRNYRQALSLRGILPPEEDGFQLNEISKLVCKTEKPTFHEALIEHQKLQLRFGNPWVTEPTSDKKLFSDKYKKKSDFEDFRVNPYIALIQLLEKLSERKGQEYLTLEEYTFFISRMAPFNLQKVLQEILDFRKLAQNDQQEIGMVYYAKQKVRTTFAKYQKKKNSSDDFRKEFKNLLYPLYDTRKNNAYYPLEYSTKENKVTIKNQKLFQILVNYIKNVNAFLQNKHGKGLYKNLSDVVYPITLIQQIEEISASNESYLKKLKHIKEQFKKNGKYSTQEWNDYIMRIDPQLLIYCFSAVLVMNNYEKIKSCETCFSDFFENYITKEFSDVVAIEKEQLIKIVEVNVYKILDCLPLSPIKESNLKNQRNDKDDYKSWVNSVKLKDLSAIKLDLQNQSYDTSYIRDKNGKRKRKRNQKLMLAVERDRIKNKKVMGKKRAQFPVENCDVCNKKFARKREPQCHHMIPIEWNGSDTEYNYAFICGKCHEVFTHDELSPKAKNQTDGLKEKGIVRLGYYKKMIETGHLGLPQIRYLQKSGYIHLVELLHLNKYLHEINQDWNDFKKDRNLLQNLDELIDKKRWTRAQKKVFAERQENNLIMEVRRDNYNVGNCDGCDTQFEKSEPECHHIIPKKQKFRKKAPEGPESPYNYAFLCRKCHQKFTSRKQERKVIVKNLKDKGLVTKETVRKMILHDGLNKLQLDYLKVESYIDETEHKELLDLMKQMEDYLK